MKFKKMGTVVLATLATVALAACGSSNDSKDSGESDKIVTEKSRTKRKSLFLARNERCARRSIDQNYRRFQERKSQYQSNLAKPRSIL